MKDENKETSERRYPPFYEKVIPIALGIIVVATVVLVGIIICVLVGRFP